MDSSRWRPVERAIGRPGVDDRRRPAIAVTLLADAAQSCSEDPRAVMFALSELCRLHVAAHVERRHSAQVRLRASIAPKRRTFAALERRMHRRSRRKCGLDCDTSRRPSRSVSGCRPPIFPRRDKAADFGLPVASTARRIEVAAARQRKVVRGALPPAAPWPASEVPPRASATHGRRRRRCSATRRRRRTETLPLTTLGPTAASSSSICTVSPSTRSRAPILAFWPSISPSRVKG